MSDSTRVWFQGSTATFRPNKTSATKGFVYRDGRRVYGSIATYEHGTIFTANAVEVAAEPELATV